MRTTGFWLALPVLLLSVKAVAQTPDLDEIWRVVQAQQLEIAQLKEALAAANEELAVASSQIDETGEYLDAMAGTSEAARTHIGGYGELHYNNLNADDPASDLEQIDAHRFVLFFGHDFSDRVRFFSELELEHSLAGDGAPGEVELEQAYLDFSLNDSLSAKAGLFLLPIGTLNETHEPPTFYGVERNSVENVIIPTTWWEAGAALNGHFANGLSWDLAAHSGLAIPATGSNAFRVRSGRQKVAEAIASDPAYTFRVRYSGMPGFDLAASYQYQSDPSQVAGDGLDTGKLFAVNAAYGIGDFTLRGLYARWDFDGAAVVAANADRQSGWYVEPSYRISTDIGDWGFYGRHEDIDGARSQDEYRQAEIGFNYWPVDGVVLKFDYRKREHELQSEAGRDFSGFDLGVGYQF